MTLSKKPQISQILFSGNFAFLRLRSGQAFAPLRELFSEEPIVSESDFYSVKPSIPPFLVDVAVPLLPKSEHELHEGLIWTKNNGTVTVDTI